MGIFKKTQAQKEAKAQKKAQKQANKQAKKDAKLARKDAKTQIKLAKANKKNAAAEVKQAKAQAIQDGTWQKTTVNDVLGTVGNTISNVFGGGASNDTVSDGEYVPENQLVGVDMGTPSLGGNGLGKIIAIVGGGLLVVLLAIFGFKK